MLGIFQGLIAMLFSAARHRRKDAHFEPLFQEPIKSLPARKCVLQAVNVVTFLFCLGSSPSATLFSNGFTVGSERQVTILKLSLSGDRTLSRDYSVQFCLPGAGIQNYYFLSLQNAGH